MNKYLIAIMVVLGLSGCIRAGDYDVFPIRKSLISSIRGYAIHNFDSETNTGTTNVRENELTMNKALTVKKGEAVISDKFYDKTSFEKTAFMPNTNGTLQSIAPTKLVANKLYDIDKWVKIDGVKYYLLPETTDGAYYLFDDNGIFYEHEGIERDGSLQILEDDIFIYPANLKMNKIVKSRDEISNVRNGYEAKYAGAELDRIWFDYLTYDGSDSSGKFERISFPNKPGLITINGKGLRVIKADDDKLTFMILKNED